MCDTLCVPYALFQDTKNYCHLNMHLSQDLASPCSIKILQKPIQGHMQQKQKTKQ